MASLIETAEVVEPARQVFEEMAAGYEDIHARLFANDPELDPAHEELTQQA